jgi:hypothetical protein
MDRKTDTFGNPNGVNIGIFPAVSFQRLADCRNFPTSLCKLLWLVRVSPQMNTGKLSKSKHTTQFLEQRQVIV